MTVTCCIDVERPFSRSGQDVTGATGASEGEDSCLFLTQHPENRSRHLAGIT